MSIPVLSLQDYLDHIGMSRDYRAADVPCEVCGSSSYTVIRNSVEVQPDICAAFNIVACNDCSFLFQNPRFSAAFYDAYYNSCYRRILSHANTPSRLFIEDQIVRGEYLFKSLSPFLAGRGKMLDVGCSAGGVMDAFLRNGWEGFGTDPDAGYIRYGVARLKAPITVQRAEDMALEPQSYNLIIMTGSVEHLFDLNKVMSICRQAAAPDALLLLEARGLAQARQVGRCGHNHRRYLTAASIELFMRKHGWAPLLFTEQELCGPSRPQSIFGIGRASLQSGAEEFHALLAARKGASIDSIHQNFRRWSIG